MFSAQNLKGIVTLVLLGGGGIVLFQLGSHTIPDANRDFFNIALGSWLTLMAMAVKRVVDGTDASDTKNDTIAALSGAVVTAQAQPAAEAPVPPLGFKP